MKWSHCCRLITGKIPRKRILLALKKKKKKKKKIERQMYHFEAILISSWVADFLVWESAYAVQRAALLAEPPHFRSLPNKNVIEG